MMQSPADRKPKLESLAEACEASAREWRRRAALSSAQRELFEEIADVAAATAVRYRLEVKALDDEQLSASMCPGDGCDGCHPELRTVADVVTWLHSDPHVREGWVSQRVENVQRMALSLLDLRDGVRDGKWKVT